MEARPPLVKIHKLGAPGTSSIGPEDQIEVMPASDYEMNSMRPEHFGNDDIGFINLMHPVIPCGEVQKDEMGLGRHSIISEQPIENKTLLGEGEVEMDLGKSNSISEKEIEHLCMQMDDMASLMRFRIKPSAPLCSSNETEDQPVIDGILKELADLQGSMSKLKSQLKPFWHKYPYEEDYVAPEEEKDPKERARKEIEEEQEVFDSYRQGIESKVRYFNYTNSFLVASTNSWFIRIDRMLTVFLNKIVRAALDSFLCLTGPSRAISADRPVEFEVQLKLKGGAAESEDSVLINSRGHYNGYDTHNGFYTVTFDNCLCTTELSLQKLYRGAVQATFLRVGIVKGSQSPFSYGGRVACSSPPQKDVVRGSECPDTPTQVVLLDSRDCAGGKMPIGEDGYLDLSRHVVSVELRTVSEDSEELKETLEVVIEAYSPGDSVQAPVMIRPQYCGISKHKCDLNGSKVKIIIAWSPIVSSASTKKIQWKRISHGTNPVGFLQSLACYLKIVFGVCDVHHALFFFFFSKQGQKLCLISSLVERMDTKASRVASSTSSDMIKSLDVKAAKQTKRSDHSPQFPAILQMNDIPPFIGSESLESFRDANELLKQEVQKLKEEVNSLRQQRELQDAELKKSEAKASEAAALAAEEASKWKAAEEVIKSLTAQTPTYVMSAWSNGLPPQAHQIGKPVHNTVAPHESMFENLNKIRDFPASHQRSNGGMAGYISSNIRGF
ncbi:hypothetical protein TRIUR3_30277 [Triticum urartu]|uniref:DUF6598 domain-containing protein n=1 Tax=Triticum urartu TaxID=4572 RepID=M7Z6L3_TRIUA|nr:hypothetical protein TRIUR3_30277 [Triticum urartu]